MNKILKSVVIFTIVLVIISCKNETKSEVQNRDKNISRIEVFDFHSTHRCMTCNAIEANTKYTLNTFFSEGLKTNKITFQVINVDKKENEKIAEKFEASGTALILNVIKKGKENKIDLTEFAFMEGNNKDSFSKQLKNKIDKELKML
ncbi:nitrophenyl compound nitroreductase subunit ArsF family protein [Lacinutrix cladophorae]